MSVIKALTARRSGALAQLPPNFHELSGAKKVDAILDIADCGDFVAALAPDEFYLLVTDIGREDSSDLLMLSTTEQRQALLDIDCWRSSELDLGLFDEWLDVLAAASIDVLVDTVKGLDPELVVTYLMSNVHAIFNRMEEMEIEQYESNWDLHWTPDLDFVLVLGVGAADDETFAHLKRMVDLIYRIDLPFARALMFSCKAGFLIEAEELAFQFREGRLADMGFPAPEDAHALYANIRVDAVKAQLEEQTVLKFHEDHERLDWALVRSVRRDGSFLTRCVELMSQPDRFATDFAHCVNRAVVASPEGVVMRDTSRIQRIAANVHATLSLALEFLADGDEATGQGLLDRAWCLQLFQVGHALAVRRAVRARKLRERAHGMFDAATEQTLTGLLSVPQPRRFDGNNFVPFSLVSELQAVDAVLDKAERVADVFERDLGFTIARLDSHDFAGPRSGRRRALV